MPKQKQSVIIAPHSHIDVEWYWTYPQAVAWAKQTISLALDYMRRDPDYHFAMDQVQLFRPALEDMAAEERSFFLEMVRQERFQAVGGMFVQPEVAEPRGESLVRQALIGAEWFRRELGVESELGWFIDTFGQMNQVPQVLARSGFKYYAFGRDVPFELGPEGVPADFWYESPDGSRVLTHLMPAHYAPSHDHQARGLARILRRSQTPFALFPYGGDVYFPDRTSAEMVAQVRAWAEDLGLIDDIADIRVAGPLDYFRAVEQYGDQLPVLRYDFNPPYYVQDLRGCYDNRIELKKRSREAEEALLEAEVVASLAYASAQPYPKLQLDDLWRRLLHQHFHDIIGGSHHDPVYRSAMAATDEVLAGARQLAAAAAGGSAAAGYFAVFNSLSTWRDELCHLPAQSAATEVVDEAGQPVPSRPVYAEDGSLALEFVARDIPGLGCRQYRLTPASGARPGAGRHDRLIGAGYVENRFFRVAWDASSGGLTEIVDKASGRNLLSPSLGLGNELVAVREHEPDLEGPMNITPEVYRSAAYAATIELEESDIHVGLVVRGPFKDCTRLQKVLLYDELPRLDFETTLVDFSGGDLLIKVSFPLALDWEKASIDYETPFGVTSRPRGHYAAQNWVDCSDGELGVALLNRGTPGYWVGNGRLELVLLRSFANYLGYRMRGFQRGLDGYAESTQTELAREHGTHHFQYTLYPHRGRWADSGVVALGQSLNRPLLAIAGEAASLFSPGHSGSSFVQVQGEFAITAVKLAESGAGLVLRGYETAGRPGQVRLRLPGWASRAALADLRERETGELPMQQGQVAFPVNPHEIVTLILRA